MGSNRITQLHVYIIGLVLMLIVGGGLYFALLKPVYQKVAAKKTELAGDEGTSVTVDKTSVSWTVETGDQNVKKAQKAVQDAKANSAAVLRQLDYLERTKQLKSGVIDLGDGTDQYILAHTMTNWLNLPRNVVPLMQQFATSLGNKHGVTVLTDFGAPASLPRPDAIPRDIIAWNLGKVQATGNFNSVMQWARDWTSAPLLVALDGLECSLAGPGGTVVADGTLTVYIFPKGKVGVVQIPAEATGGTGGGGFGGGGNGPAGMPFGGGGNGPAGGGGGGMATMPHG